MKWQFSLLFLAFAPAILAIRLGTRLVRHYYVLSLNGTVSKG
jgi:hypothetical protein